ncbi:MAG TPA: nucleoside deaminase [Allosphingosinicella sp.]|nr:nucleoside deaminase [Allosphingosinicella sp.]
MSFPLPEPMRLALAEARSAALDGEVPVGAVVSRDGEVLAIGRNRMRETADPTAHAEMVALRGGAARLGSPRLDGCDLWVTLEPCAMCAGAIALARVERLYFGAADPKGGAVLHGPRLFAQPTCHHAPEVYSGIGEGEAAAMLRDFFRERRMPADRRLG